MNIKVVDYISKCALQLCPTLCDPMDCSLPVSSVHGIHHARIPEWIAMPSSREQIFLTQGLNPCLRHLLHWQVGSFPQGPPGEPFILLQMTEIVPPYTQALLPCHLFTQKRWSLFLLPLNLGWHWDHLDQWNEAEVILWDFEVSSVKENMASPPLVFWGKPTAM